MAKSNLGGKRATQTTPTSSTTTGTRTYTTLTDTEAAQIRSDVDASYNANVKAAVKLYISDATNPSGYSDSQELNYALDNNLPLDENLKFIDKNLSKGMHDIGKDIQLIRGSHDDMLKDMGINDYTKLTQQQLQNQLIGTQIQSKAYMSFSYDESKNPFLSGPQSGGREVIWKVNAKSDTKIVFGAKSQAEMITNKGTNFKITNVYYNGQRATPRTGGTKPVIVIEAETL